MKDVLLLTPGPTPIQADAHQALSLPMLGHMDAAVFEINSRIQRNLKVLYGASDSAFAACLAGTGSMGMDAGFANLLERGDEVLVCANGSFGYRMADMAERYGAVVRLVEAPIGEAVQQGDVARALKTYPNLKMLAVVHGETSTGVLNPAPEIADLVRGTDILVTVDAVTTAGMMPYQMHDWNIDYAYTGSQKCLSAPPGLAPMAVSERAMTSFMNRKTKAPLWYADFDGLRDYWDKRQYHHTIPVQLHYALDAALEAALREGLEVRAQRVTTLSSAVAETLGEIGFSHFVERPAERLPTVLSLRLPKSVDDAQVRAELRERNICITGGLGATSGLIWRLGLMGEAARGEHYLRFMNVLGSIIGEKSLEGRLAEKLGVVAPV